MLRHMLAATIFGLTLSACAAPETASREETVSLTGVVRGVDTGSRRLTVEGPDRTVVYRVSDEVRNFDQIEVGDRVSLNYYESVAVAMADPDDPGDALTDTFGARSAEGARPGAVGAAVTTFVVELVAYDAPTGIATIRTPQGEVRSVRVARELRRFAAARDPGDRILVLVEEAVAVGVAPA
jgi:Cu/Ag efflux protein CusF